MKRSFAIGVLIVGLPLLAGAVNCTMSYPKPTFWQMVKVLWGVTTGTCSQ